MRTKRNSKKNNALFPIACVVLCVLVILLVFLVKKDEIFTNLKETDFFGRIFGSTPELIENHESKPSKTEVPLKNNDIVVQVQEPETVPLIEPESSEVINKGDSKANVNEDSPVTEKSDSKVLEESKSSETKEEKPAKPKAVGTTKVDLCFVIIDGDGTVVRKNVKRTVSKNDSPLTTAINLLLAGPDLSNKAESDCTTLIPEGTKLLSARVSDGVAYLNFNDVFEFNPYGVEGAIHQLEQIVYTATAFSTVNSVQFLIDGKKREYMGSEGQWIGSPLSRASF